VRQTLVIEFFPKTAEPGILGVHFKIVIGAYLNARHGLAVLALTLRGASFGGRH
jgi:hypothetical protein